MVKKFLILKHLSFSIVPSYYCETDGNLDGGKYHGNKFKGKRYDSYDYCLSLLPKLMNEEMEHWDGHTEYLFSIEEVYEKI